MHIPTANVPDDGLDGKHKNVQIGGIPPPREGSSLWTPYLDGLCPRARVGFNLVKEDIAYVIINPYSDLIVLHIRVVEDYIDDGCPRRELSHWWPIGSIAHAYVAHS